MTIEELLPEFKGRERQDLGGAFTFLKNEKYVKFIPKSFGSMSREKKYTLTSLGKTWAIRIVKKNERDAIGFFNEAVKEKITVVENNDAVNERTPAQFRLETPLMEQFAALQADIMDLDEVGDSPDIDSAVQALLECELWVCRYIALKKRDD